MSSYEALMGAIDLMIDRLDEMDKKIASVQESLKKLGIKIDDSWNNVWETK